MSLGRKVLSSGIGLLCSAIAVFGEVRYLSDEEALRLAFPSGEKVIAVSLYDVPAHTKAVIEKAAGVRLLITWTRCFQGMKEGKVQAYACIDNMLGKAEPITYLIRINHPAGEIAFVELMVYRESIGAEVRHPLFRKQFERKGLHNPLRLGLDISKISGATLSSRAFADGSRKVLQLYQHYLKQLPPLE